MTNNQPDPDATNTAAWHRLHLINTLELIWDDEHLDDVLDHLLHPQAADMRIHGHDAAAVVDAIAHRLDSKTAGFWFGFGFTGHQAHLLDHSVRAEDNVNDRPTSQVGDLLLTDLPRD